MSNYTYVAIDPHGCETRGTIDVSTQSEALQRLKEMGVFPTKLLEQSQRGPSRGSAVRVGVRKGLTVSLPRLGGRIKSRALAVFTRQLATLIEAGLPLLRGLRILQEQEENPNLRRVLGELSLAIENGSSLAEALGQHPKSFNRLYVNMVKAGEMGGALELTLSRLAGFIEKAQKIKGKVISALFYPCAVLLVAGLILGVMMVFVVPRFRQVFEGLLNGRPLPAFTRFVFGLSELVQHHFLTGATAAGILVTLFLLALRTTWGRWTFDRAKLAMPVLGPVFRKIAISRFARTLGTLAGSGVPILQALNIVKETAGNVVVSQIISTVHDRVKEGDPIAPALKASSVFPAMVAGMVDVGEQTGALPEMLMKIAENYDEEVDNATGAMTSLLEPILIVFLAVIVGSIVIAMFLPIIRIGEGLTNDGPAGNG